MLGAVSQAEQRRSVGLRPEGASAAIIGADAIKPAIEARELVIGVELPRLNTEQHSELTGLVLDPRGRPVPGAPSGWCSSATEVERDTSLPTGGTG